MDELDLAAERIQAFDEVALHLVLNRSQGPLSSGVCRSCGERIESLRLKTAPHTRLCSDCAREEEQRAKRERRSGQS